MRNKFLAELEKEKKGRQGGSSTEQKREAPRTSYSDGNSSSQGGYGIAVALGLVGCLLMVPFLTRKSSVSM
jgi:hypothetical protein